MPSAVVDRCRGIAWRVLTVLRPCKRFPQDAHPYHYTRE